MEVVVYTQRVEIIDSYKERRDCTDQNIPKLIGECGYLSIPLPNISEMLEEMIKYLRPCGIILTGGNSLVKYGGMAPERDRTDQTLIRIALQENIPLYGICRGMQSIMDYFGCDLENVGNHVAVRHKVEGEFCREVNSYHNQAARVVKPPLIPAALAEDGIVEAVRHEDKAIYGTMWHPEREVPYNRIDIDMIKNFFM